MPDDNASADAAQNTFTPITSQEELDRTIGARLARERDKYADYDDLKAKAAKFDEVDAANKSELQKAQEAIAERDARLAELPKTARAQAIQFASAATRKNFLDPEDALAFIGDVDLSDAAAVDAALDALAERKPHLVRAEAKKPPTRPKARDGEPVDNGDGLKGKERAAAALRQFRNV